MRLTWFSSFETPSAFLLVFGVLVNKEGTEGLVGPSWMGFLGHPWFLSHASQSTHPALPGMGYGCILGRCTALVPAQVSWPAVHGDMKLSSPTLELSLCKLRTNIDLGWANAARISPAGACFPCSASHDNTHYTDQSPCVRVQLCLHHVFCLCCSAKVGKEKGRGDFFFLAISLKDLSTLNPLHSQQPLKLWTNFR